MPVSPLAGSRNPGYRVSSCYIRTVDRGRNRRCIKRPRKQGNSDDEREPEQNNLSIECIPKSEAKKFYEFATGQPRTSLIPVQPASCVRKFTTGISVQHRLTFLTTTLACDINCEQTDIIVRMAAIVVRNLPDEVMSLLKKLARKHGRSTEAEVREILNKAVEPLESRKLGSNLLALGKTTSTRNLTHRSSDPIEPAEF